MNRDNNPRGRVYCVITGDLFHYGHSRFLANARKLGNELWVGICSDEDAENYKRAPILSLAERCELVGACRYVDKVIPGAPPQVSSEWVTAHNIDTVVVVDNYSEAELQTYFLQPRELGILRKVPYTPGISTTDIISRCHHAVVYDEADKRSLKSETYRSEVINAKEEKKKSKLSVVTTDEEPANLSSFVFEVANTLKPHNQQPLLIIGDQNRRFTSALSGHEVTYIKGVSKIGNTLTTGPKFGAMIICDVLCKLPHKAPLLNELLDRVSESGQIVAMERYRRTVNWSREIDDYVYREDLYLCGKEELISVFENQGFSVTKQTELESKLDKSKSSKIAGWLGIYASPKCEKVSPSKYVI